MALPLTVEAIGRVPGHNPPHKSSGGNYYFVTGNASNAIDVEKTANPSTTASVIQDGGNAPTESPSNCLASVSDGTSIHIVCLDATNLLLQYSRFNMSTDTWSVTDITIADLTGMSTPSQPWCSIVYNAGRTTELVVAASGLPDSVMGSAYQRVDFWHADVAVTTAGGWTGPTSLDSTTEEVNQLYPQAGSGSSGNVHIFWSNAAGVLRHKSLNSSDSLSSLQTNSVSFNYPTVPVGYDDAGTFRVAVAATFVNTSITPYYGAESSGVLGAMTASSISGGDPDNGPSAVSIACDGADFYIHWCDDVTNDLFYSVSTDNGANWGTPVEELDAITATSISTAFLDSGKIAYLYDDGGSTKYNELALSADTNVSASAATLTLTANAATVSNDVNVGASAASLSLTANAATITVAQDTEVNASAATLALTANAATITYDVDVQASAATLALTANPASVAHDIEVLASAASLALAANAASITLDTNVSANAASLSVTANAASITYDVEVLASAASLSLAANQATIAYGVNVEASAASLSLTANAASIVYDVDVQASAATLAVTANPASITYDVNVLASAASLSVTANQSAISLDVEVQCSPATLALTANQAVITRDVNILASAASLTLTANPASLNADTNVQASAATLALTANQAAITYDVEVNASAASLAIAANQAAIALDAEVQAAAATLTVTAHQATISLDVEIQAAPATLTITGNQATITTTGDTTVVCQVVSLTLVANQATIGLTPSGGGSRRRENEINVQAANDDLTNLVNLLILSGVLDGERDSLAA